MRTRSVAVLAALLLTLTACSDGGDDPGTDPTTGSAASGRSPSDQASTGEASPGEPAPTDPASTPAPSGPAGGTATEPAVLEPATDLLAWKKVPGPVTDLATTGGAWTLSVDEQGTRARLQGPTALTVPAGKGRRISDSLLNGEYAVVVAQDKREERAAVATVIELATGRRTVLDERSAQPTVNGGTWALGPADGEGGPTLLHATQGEDGAYCLARVDLGSGTSESAWCSPRRHGFNNARVTPAGSSLLTFDDSRPSCFTVVELTGQQTTPFPDVTACKGWDGLVLDGGRAWSVVPKANQVETAHFYAQSERGHFDLGEGTSGSLTWCAGAAYFAQDPQGDGEPARLLRWDGAALSVVYETPGWPAFVSEPRCGGDRITLTSLSEGGDEQVSAPVG